jgi:alpha-maltose-1-phosphate synthase
MSDRGAAHAIVANPGHLPWMPRVAARLHELGALAAYYAPVAVSAEQIEWVRTKLPGPIAQRLAEELRRRQVPAALDGAPLRAAAAPHELVNVIARRLRIPNDAIRSLADWRDAAFDAAVARKLDPSVSAALVAYAAAEKTIQAAAQADIRTCIDYPVAHHAYDEALLQEEQRLVPEYAATMQFHRPGRARKTRLDRELAGADRILALSEFHRHTFIEAGIDERKISVVPFGVDSEFFRPGIRDESKRFAVLFVGQITQRKGISYLIEGFRRAAIPDSELVLVGRPFGSSRPWRSTPGVRHVEMIAPWQTPSLYQAADVFVLPAISEAFGRVVLEAMSCGVPAIVSEQTGAADAVVEGENGFVIPIRDADAIAERLLTLYRAPELRLSMGASGREAALTATWDRYTNSVADLLRA